MNATFIYFCILHFFRRVYRPKNLKLKIEKMKIKSRKKKYNNDKISLAC